MRTSNPHLAKTQRSALLRLAWPAVLEMMLHTSVWTLDTIMVGRLGASALSAVALGGQFCWTILFVVASLGTGTMILVARRVGAGEREEALRTSGMAITLMLFLALAVSLCVYLLAPSLFSLAGTKPDVSQQGTEYLKIVGLSGMFLLPAIVGNAIMRGWGNTRTPLYIIGAVNTCNLVLDYVFIFGHLGFPAMGVRGAALATFCAHVLAFVLAAWFLFFRWKETGLGLSCLGRLQYGTARSLIALSIPTGLEWFAIDGSRTVQTLLIASLGTRSLASHQVAVVAESLSFMPGWGFAIATTILVGQNLGARQWEAAEESARQGTLLSLAGMGGFALVFLLFPRALTSVFTTNTEVIALGAQCLMVAAFAQPFVAIAETLAGALRGAGDTRSPFFISALASWAVRIPLTFLCIRVFHLGLPYVWAATAVEWLVRSALTAVLFRKGGWKSISI